MISLDFKSGGPTRLFSLLKNSRNSWTKAVAHPRGIPTLLFITKIRFVDLGDFNELSVIWGITRKNERIRKKKKFRIESPINIS